MRKEDEDRLIHFHRSVKARAYEDAQILWNNGGESFYDYFSIVFNVFWNEKDWQLFPVARNLENMVRNALLHEIEEQMIRSHLLGEVQEP